MAIVEDDEDDPYPINSETEKRCYLSSKRLMYFFGNQFYELARTIGKGSLTSSAKLLGPKVLCREEVEGTLKEAKWHFIPTIEVGHWPDDAFEFFLRKRIVMRDRRTGLSYQVLNLSSNPTNTKYSRQWPNMKHRIFSSGQISNTKYSPVSKYQIQNILQWPNMKYKIFPTVANTQRVADSAPAWLQHSPGWIPPSKVMINQIY